MLYGMKVDKDSNEVNNRGVDEELKHICATIKVTRDYIYEVTGCRLGMR